MTSLVCDKDFLKNFDNLPFRLYNEGSYVTQFDVYPSLLLRAFATFANNYVQLFVYFL